MKILVLTCVIGLYLNSQAQNIGINTPNPQAALDLNGDMVLRSQTLMVTNGITHSLDINTIKASHYRLNGAASNFVIAGILAGVADRIITLINQTGSSMELYHLDTNTDAALRIHTGTGATLAIYTNGTVTLQYDSTAQIWRVLGQHNSSLDSFGGTYMGPPKLSCSEVLAMNNPEVGILIYNTLSQRYNFYDGTDWRNMDHSLISDTQNVGPAPSGTNTTMVGTNSAQLAWASVSDAVLYRITYANTAFPNVLQTHFTSDTNYNLTGLLANTEYSWSVKAITPCGQSISSISNNFSTLANQANITVDFAFNPETVNLGVGGTITFTGSFSSHPIRGGTPASPNNFINVNSGNSYTHTFSQPGVFNVHCTLHGNVCTIVVE